MNKNATEALTKEREELFLMLERAIEACSILRPLCKDGADFADVLDSFLPEGRILIKKYKKCFQ
jgi:hypothetical protein